MRLPSTDRRLRVRIASHLPCPAPPPPSSPADIDICATAPRRILSRTINNFSHPYLITCRFLCLQNERLTASKGCGCAKTRGWNRCIGAERQLDAQQEAEEGGSEAHHYNGGSRVGASLFSPPPAAWSSIPVLSFFVIPSYRGPRCHLPEWLGGGTGVFCACARY